MNGLFDPRREHDACGVGFVAYLDGQSRHDVMHMALGAMTRMAHRGGGDGKNGDGAGILFPLPRDFFLRQWPALSVCAAPWAVAQLFLPRDAALRALCLQRFREIFTACGLRVEDERDVPVREDVLAPAARQTMPGFLQLLVLPDTSSPEAAELHDPEALERRLFLARHMAENLIWKELRRQGQDTRLFYVASCSCRSIVYKGMLPGSRLGEFYTDLTDEDCAAPFAVFHERFSTNTLPSWPLAQPFRLAAHNGEINTLRGNAAHMGVREAVLASPLLGAHLKDALPVINPDTSDSGTLDNVLELLVRAGYTLPHALMMMVPEPFGPTFVMGDNKRAFYEYHSSLMEPWDGPTCLVFTDGWRRVGAMLDRNGLRPCRWSVSRDGLMVLGSESGLVDVSEEDIIQRGQLQPRRMILADVEHHRIAPDAEIKGQVIRSQPWRRWLQKHAVRLETLNGMGEESDAAHALPPLDRRLRQAGCDSTWQRQVLVPMAENAQEPVCSMGTDKPLPCLSDEPQSLFRWFKQRFAQVTNPPIDPYREQLSMSLMGHAGRAGNILEPGPESCAVLRLPHPFLTTDDMRRIRASRRPAVRAATLDATFPAHGDGEALRAALDRLFADAEAAIAQGATILVVSDTAMTADKAPIPALLACAGLHHHLIRAGLRHACGIIAESGEACEVIHMAQLIGYGVNAVCPHAALDAVRRMAREGRLSTDAGPLDEEDAQERYINALKKGLLKAFARLGISTLRSFRGS
uniref:glutamate synthase central domain-containing protein n=1 Tax=Desulfovibrio sp. TaxID=885 RepID=UPI003AB60894